MRHLDESKRVGKHPHKFHERNKPNQEREERLIADSFGVHERNGNDSNDDPQVDIALMSFDMHHLVDDTYDDDNGDDDDDVDEDGDDVEEEEGEDDNRMDKKLEGIPDVSEWGTCPDCKGCGLLGNMCLECNEDGMTFENNPQWIYYTKEGVVHMINISRRIIRGEALVSMVIGKVIISTPETAVENFLQVMAEASSEPDVAHYINSRSELLKLCGMKSTQLPFTSSESF